MVKSACVCVMGEIRIRHPLETFVVEIFVRSLNFIFTISSLTGRSRNKKMDRNRNQQRGSGYRGRGGYHRSSP